MSKPRIIFMGTPDFAKTVLLTLAEKYEVVAAVTQTDKPVGRKRIMTAPPVKTEALKLGIPVFQFQTLKNGELRPILDEYKPDIIVVAAYGKLLPDYVLNYPKYGCLNVHGSLLPKYRGAGPVQWAVINGEKETGITVMLMGDKMDTGDMLMKQSVFIGEYETYGELMERLAPVGSALILKAIDGWINGSLIPEKQNDDEATYAPMLDKKMALIDFSKSSSDVLHMIHGLNPWPVAFTYRNGKKLKIFNAVYGNKTDKPCGYAVMTEENDGIEISCGDGRSIIATTVQLEGAKKMGAKSYLAGNPINDYTVLKMEA